MSDIGKTYNPYKSFYGSFIPNSILRRKELSPSAKLVYGRLLQYAGKDGKAYPSYKTLAKEVGLQRRQVIRIVKDLEEVGLIKIVQRTGGDGSLMSNYFEFLKHQMLLDDPRVRNDTRGSDKNDTTPRCQTRHQVVSSMAPEEIQTSRNEIETTTIESVRLLLSGSPLETIKSETLEALGRRYGFDKLIKAADVAVQTWKRFRNEIINPGGYLRSFCPDLIIPEWYQPPDVREEMVRNAENQKAVLQYQQNQEKVRAEEVGQEQEEIWSKLTEEEREGCLLAAKDSVNKKLGEMTSETITAIAKKIAYDDQKKWDFYRPRLL